jgi:hypothetical protein
LSSVTFSPLWKTNSIPGMPITIPEEGRKLIGFPSGTVIAITPEC